MRHLTHILALLLALIGSSWAALAVPLNEQPMYGNQPKTTEMQAADDQFIANAAKLGYNRVQASDKSVQLGWQYFSQRHDIATAMKRFNQAWLADPDNGDAFHGFAILVMERDHDATQADDLFQKGIAKPRQSPGIWLDYGRFLLSTSKPAAAVPVLRKALTFSDMGPDAQALLTIALYSSGDVAAACTERDKVLDGAQQSIRSAIRQLRCPS
jgi:Tfp pilus assembly protein PilF